MQHANFTNRCPKQPAYLRRELLALRTQLEQAIASQEFSDPADAEDAQESLVTAETELAKPQPNGNRVLRKLDELSQIITRSAETADAAGKLGARVIRLAPVAATLWQVTQHLSLLKKAKLLIQRG